MEEAHQCEEAEEDLVEEEAMAVVAGLGVDMAHREEVDIEEVFEDEVLEGMRLTKPSVLMVVRCVSSGMNCF